MSLALHCTWGAHTHTPILINCGHGWIHVKTVLVINTVADGGLAPITVIPQLARLVRTGSAAVNFNEDEVAKNIMHETIILTSGDASLAMI